MKQQRENSSRNMKAVPQEKIDNPLQEAKSQNSGETLRIFQFLQQTPQKANENTGQSTFGHTSV